MSQTLIAQATVDIAGELDSLSGGGATIQTDLGVIVASFLGAAILIGAVATFGFMVMGGVLWVTSGGDKGKVEKAQNMITQSIVGLGVLASSYALFQIVQYFFGISILG